jgi:ELWxxDGT repeat protein
MNFLKNAKAFLKMLAPLSIFMLLSIFSYSQTGQKATLVKDILDGPFSSNPTNFTTVGDIVYFTANDGLGNAIWKSYGTGAGTVKVSTSLSNPQGYNGKLYYITRFLKKADIDNALLWAYDGNSSVIVDTLKEEYGSIINANLSVTGSVLNIALTYSNSGSSTQWSLKFVSKGTNGTTKFKENLTTIAPGGNLYQYNNFNLADTLAFYDLATSTAGNPNSSFLYSIKKGQIWTARASNFYKIIKGLGTIGDRLLYIAPTNNYVYTGFGTVVFNLYSIDINGDSILLKTNISSVDRIGTVQPFNSKIYFTDANNKIWETNGTSAGTVAITDGTTTALPLSMNNTIVLADGLYFYDKFNNEFRIWKISSTGNIRKIMSIPNSTDKDIRLANLNNELWQFTNVNSSVTTESPFFLYKIDAVNGTRQAIGAANGIDIYDTNKYTTTLTAAGLRLFVNANDSSATNVSPKGNELFLMSLEPSIANCNTDNVAPYFGYCPASTVKNITADRDTAWYPIPTAFDNCSTPSVSLQLTGVHHYGEFPTGHSVAISKDSTARFEYTATDAKGNTAKCIFTVKILKPCVPISSTFNTPCPRDTNISTVDACTRVTWTVPTATDNCGNSVSVTQTQGLPSGSCFALGSQTISYTKEFGGVCSFNVTVSKINTPTCIKYTANNTVSSCNPANALPYIMRFEANIYTNANVYTTDSLEFKETANGYAYLKGVIRSKTGLTGTINLMFTDKRTKWDAKRVNCLPSSVSTENWYYYLTAVGNIVVPGYGSRSIMAALDPLQIGIGANTQDLNQLGGYTRMTDGPLKIELAFRLANPLSYDCPVTTDCANDVDPPVLSPSPDTIVVKCGSILPPTIKYTATDNCTPTNQLENSSSDYSGITTEGVRILQNTYADARGNKAARSLRIYYTGEYYPKYTACPQNQIVDSINRCVTWAEPTAVDGCGKPISNSLQSHQSGFCFAVGTTTVSYFANDGGNNNTNCQFTVTVKPNPISGICKKYIASSTNSICNPATWQPYLLRIDADRYTADNLEFKEMSDGTATLKGTLRSPSWQAVAINLTFSGRTTTATPQKINCLPPSVSTANWAYYPTVSGTIALPSGTVTINTVSHALQIGRGANTQNINELGGYTKLSNGTISLDLAFKMTNETIIACDSIPTNLCDNDIIPPVISNCPVNINLTTTGTTPIANWLTPTATDNCTTTPSVSSNYSSGFAFPIGTTNVVYTAKDIKNNAATCGFSINVTSSTNPCDTDTQAPVLNNCPTNINLTTTGTTAIATWTAPTATDNCTTTPSVSSNYNSGFAFPIGTTNVVYTAKDVKNNASTCSFNVIVTQQVTGQDVCINPTANVKGGASSIIISGITTSSAIVQIFNATWSSVYNQQVSGSSVTIPNLTAGNYQVKVTVLGAGGRWPSLCEVLVNNVAVTAGNPCDNDIIAPTFSNCPSNINLTITGTTGVATWVAPTATDNCTTTPSVSSNYNSGFAFPIGTTNVIYTAKDAKNNKSTCRFNVIVAKQLDGITIKYSSHTLKINEKVCVSVSADSFFNIVSAQWTNTFNPAVLRFDSVINFTALGSRIVDFGVSARSTGFVDFTFVGLNRSVPNGTKLYDLCFTAIGQPGSTTLLKQEDVPRFISEIYKDPTTLAVLKTSPGTVTIEGTATYAPDVALSIVSNPTTYRQWTTNTFRISAKNNGTQAMSNIKIQFQYPDKTVKGGDVIPSVGTWNEYCSGGILCYEWTIPTLAPNATATLDVPLFVLGATAPIIATTKLLTSTPADGNASNNTATVTVSPTPAASQMLQAINRTKPTQYIPIVIQTVAPNPTEGDVLIEIESIVEKEVRFDFYNTLGKIVKSETRAVKKGENYLQFDFWNETNGVYFIQTNVGQGRGVPLKFVKL